MNIELSPDIDDSENEEQPGLPQKILKETEGIEHSCSKKTDDSQEETCEDEEEEETQEEKDETCEIKEPEEKPVGKKPFIETKELEQNENLSESMIEKIFVERKNLYIGGQGGTGKSRLLKDIKIYAENVHHLNVGIASTTGASAFSIGATTLHSWAGIKLGRESVETICKKIKTKKECLERWLHTDLLLIDEVSMLGASILELVSDVGSSLRKRKNDPFGGIQVIFTGDFLQLPPINDLYAFESVLWDELNLEICILSHPYRFLDKDFFYMLARIRLGKPLEQDFQKLEERQKVYVEYIRSDRQKTEQIHPTLLFSLKRDVEAFNLQELNKIKEKEWTYRSYDKIHGRKGTQLSEYERKNHVKFLDSMIPSLVCFKKGAQVMLTYNMDAKNGLVNGTRGVVTECFKTEVEVLVKNGSKIMISFHEHEFDDGRIKAIRYQIPLILASALSIHRSQGCSLDYAIVDIGPSVFGPHMTYVALSRLRTLEGVLVQNFARKSIFCNQKALDYEEKLNEKSSDVIYV